MKKDVPLEAIRGLAAIAVLLGHVVIAFVPSFNLHSVIAFVPSFDLRTTPLNAAINGSASVILFFVLSGFVLTRKYFAVGDDAIIVRGVVKRWPRLMGPVLITCVASWALIHFHVLYYAQAAEITHSTWLQVYGGQGPPAYPLNWVNALKSGFFMVFVQDDYAHYNTPLWTMKFEFLGSLLCFGFAMLLHKLRGGRRLTGVFAAGLVFLVVWLSMDRFYLGFPIGVILARWLPTRHELPAAAAVPMTLVALYLLGYAEVRMGAYEIFTRWPVTFVPVSLAGSVLAIAVVNGYSPIRRWLSGRVMLFIGELSFPLYLVHVLVICSFGSLVLLRTGSIGVACAASIVGSVIAALPLIWFNRRWVDLVNRLADWLLAQSPAAGLARTPEPVGARPTNIAAPDRAAGG